MRRAYLMWISLFLTLLLMGHAQATPKVRVDFYEVGLLGWETVHGGGQLFACEAALHHCVLWTVAAAPAGH